MASCCIALRAGGVSLVLEVPAEGLPAIVHWGADLGELTASDTAALLASAVHPAANNVMDEPVRLAVLPEHWTGWVGRPGVSGSRGGRDWSPRFATTAVRVDDVQVAFDADTLIALGAASVAVDAVDQSARLALTLTFELPRPGWSAPGCS